MSQHAPFVASELPFRNSFHPVCTNMRRLFFLFWIWIEFLPGHASIALEPGCKVPAGQHILSISPGHGLAPNATVTAEVRDKRISFKMIENSFKAILVLWHIIKCTLLVQFPVPSTRFTYLFIFLLLQLLYVETEEPRSAHNVLPLRSSLTPTKKVDVDRTIMPDGTIVTTVTTVQSRLKLERSPGRFTEQRITLCQVRRATRDKRMLW